MRYVILVLLLGALAGLMVWPAASVEAVPVKKVWIPTGTIADGTYGEITFSGGNTIGYYGTKEEAAAAPEPKTVRPFEKPANGTVTIDLKDHDPN